MQGYLRSRLSTGIERFIYMGNNIAASVEAVGLFRLQLETSIYMDLDETFGVQLFRRNLISVSSLGKSGYYCSFGNNKFDLYQNSNLVSTGSLVDSLYMLDTNTSFNESLHINKHGTKHKLTYENSTIL